MRWQMFYQTEMRTIELGTVESDSWEAAIQAAREVSGRSLLYGAVGVRKQGVEVPDGELRLKVVWGRLAGSGRVRKLLRAAETLGADEIALGAI